jgi:biopolymer transport protein ExbB
MNMKLRKLVLGLLTAVVLCWGLMQFTSHVRAQDPAPAVTTAAPAKAGPTSGMRKDMTLWDWFVVGGWCMWPLLACSVAGVGLVIRNEITLQRKKLLLPELIPQIEECVRRFDFPAARQICQQNPSLITNILDVGLERTEVAGVNADAMQRAMEEASTEQMASYLIPINLVNTIAVVAPMLGLLGTVSGMIKAFFNISLGGMGKPEMLANNIGEALITTEAGLIIAIPAMAYYFYCKNKFVSAVATAGKMIGKIMDGLKANAAA